MKKIFQISSLTLVFLFSMFIHAHPTEAPSKKQKPMFLCIPLGWERGNVSK